MNRTLWGAAFVLLLPLSAPAQDSPATAPSGLGLGMGVVVTRPFLNAPGREPFQGVGRFRAGPGMAVWLRFDRQSFGASVGAEAAGLDIGPEIVRDGIRMGREASVYASVHGSAHWRPALRMAGWRPELHVGGVGTSLGQVMARPDQLPGYARDSAGGPADSVARPLSLRGRGVRFGFAAERTWGSAGLPGDASVRIEVSTDAVWFRTLEAGNRTVRLPRTASGNLPRLMLGLQWRPNAPEAPDGATSRPGAGVAGP
ncbi:hypothetical protein [Longimicrobium sp.]|uniref:hypothetical protein n=1 Tax=Longimicrobium sp. TaxID=2029185 RepID=UPI002E368A62|nr:hypothetical protein [Longimicrobium sp.]HEX6042597.1 hypothetical protein [Longimicrobium sp.]